MNISNEKSSLRKNCKAEKSAMLTGLESRIAFTVITFIQLKYVGSMSTARKIDEVKEVTN